MFFPPNVILGYTPQLSGQGRGQEIKEWLKTNISNNRKIENFVILEDSKRHHETIQQAGLGFYLFLLFLS